MLHEKKLLFIWLLAFAVIAVRGEEQVDDNPVVDLLADAFDVSGDDNSNMRPEKTSLADSSPSAVIDVPKNSGTPTTVTKKSVEAPRAQASPTSPAPDTQAWLLASSVMQTTSFATRLAKLNATYVSEMDRLLRASYKAWPSARDRLNATQLQAKLLALHEEVGGAFQLARLKCLLPACQSFLNLLIDQWKNRTEVCV